MKSFNFILLIATALLSCKKQGLSLAEEDNVAENIYYISSEGNDNQDGLTPATAWKSLKDFQPGNEYLFRRGDTIFVSIPKITGNTLPIKVGAYGEGAKPVLSTYQKIVNTGWESVGGNVWRVNLADPNNYTGYVPVATINVGFLKVDNVIYGRKRFLSTVLDGQWHFYSEHPYLYVYSTANLNESSSDIEVASTNTSIVALSNEMTISDVQLIGGGGHGIQGNQVRNIKIEDVDIEEIGGAHLVGHGDGYTRYGNGIEFYGGALNCIVKRCTVKQVYDVAFTMQGRGEGSLINYFKDIIFQDNYSLLNEQTFEVWITGGTSGYEGCEFSNNTGEDAGFGWSHDVRPDKNVGVHMLSYAWQVGPGRNDLTITNNIFKRGRSGYIFYQEPSDINNFYTIESNEIHLQSGVPIRVGANFFLPDNGDFFAATGLEQYSSFILTN